MNYEPYKFSYETQGALQPPPISAPTSTLRRIAEAVKAAWYAGLGGGSPVSSRSRFQADIFWPCWPDQCPALPTGCLDFSDPLERSALVQAAITFAGTNLAEAPLEVNELTADGWDPVPDHPLVALFNRPNPYMSGETVIKNFARNWLVWGNAYLYKARDERRRVRELWPLPAQNVKVISEGNDFITFYEYMGEQVQRIDPGDIIHFRYGLDPRDQRVGLSPLRAAAEDLLTDEEATRYNRQVLSNYGVPPYAVMPKPRTDDVYDFDEEKLKAQLIARTSGAERLRPLVFKVPMDVHTFGFTPDQMKASDVRRTPEARVAAVLGIPAIVLGYEIGLERSTFANYESALKQAYVSWVVPTWRIVSSELREQLLPDFEANTKNISVDFDLNEVRALREGEDAQHARARADYAAGVITLNEARVAMGYEALPDGDALRAPAASPFAFQSAGWGPQEQKAFLQWDEAEIMRYMRELVSEREAAMLQAEAR